MSVSLSLIYPTLVLMSSVILYLSLNVSGRTIGTLDVVGVGVVVLLALLFGVLGYCTVSHPDYSLDWERISYEIEWAREVGPLPLLQGSYSAHPLSAVLMYLVGIIGSPRLLRFMASFVFAICVGIVAWKLGKKEGFLVGGIVFFSAFATVDYGNSLLVNIRFELAAVLCIFGYLNLHVLSGNRLISYAFIFTAVGLHSGVLFVAVLVLLLNKTNRGGSSVIYCLLLSFGPLTLITAPFLEQLPIVGPKIEAYVSSGWSNGATSLKNMMFNLALPLLGLVFSMRTALDKGSGETNEVRSLSRCVLGLSLFSFSMLLLTDNFARYAQLIPLLLTPLMALRFKSESIELMNGSQGFILTTKNAAMIIYLLFIVLTLVFRSLFTYRFYEVLF